MVDLMFRMNSRSMDAQVFQNLSLWVEERSMPVLLNAKIDLSIILLSKNGEISLYKNNPCTFVQSSLSGFKRWHLLT